MITRIVKIAGSGLGLGYLPVAPGTWGSLGGILLWWLTLPMGRWLQALLLIVLLIPAVLVCGACERRAGGDDPSFVVLDEILGMYLALLFIPPGWPWIVAAFLLFRLLDITKPWPVNLMERHYSGGTAIMLDDLAAGAITAMILTVIQVVVAVI